MPNAGDQAELGNRDDREAYIVSKVQDAARHPKASLFFATASRCKSPNEAAKVAEEELGLQKEEIRHTRWVALFQKGKTRAEFLSSLKELLGNGKSIEEIVERQEEEMKVVRGKQYYDSIVRNRLRPVCDWLRNLSAKEIVRRRMPLAVNPSFIEIALVSTDPAYVDVLVPVRIESFVYGNSEYQVKEWKKNGWQWPDLKIVVRDKNKKFFYLAQVIGRAYERRVKRECVTIERDYPVKK